MFRNKPNATAQKREEISHLSEFTVIRADIIDGEDEGDDDRDPKKAKFTFQCARCPSAAFASVYQLIAHKKDVCPAKKCGNETENGDGGREYSCFVCDAKFPWIGSLARHVLKHADARPYACHLCDKRYINRNELKMHLLSHDDARSFGCDECGRMFTTRGNLNVHLKIHTGKRDFKCPICPKSFIVRSHLRSHMSLHEEKQFQCDLCDLKFHRKTTLNYHMNAVHEDMRNFQCPICKKSFKGHLTDHMRIHSAEKPYSCEECGASFRQRSQLKVHSRQHTGTKPYKCSRCLKTFRHSTALKIHLQNHNGEKPYGCSICSRPFGQLSHLKKHLKTIHNVLLPYLCRVCNTHFSTQAKLSVHWENNPSCGLNSSDGDKGGLVLLHNPSSSPNSKKIQQTPSHELEDSPPPLLSSELEPINAEPIPEPAEQSLPSSCDDVIPMQPLLPTPLPAEQCQPVVVPDEILREDGIITTTLTLEQVEGFAMAGYGDNPSTQLELNQESSEYLTLSNVGACVSDGILVCNGRPGVEDFDFCWTLQLPEVGLPYAIIPPEPAMLQPLPLPPPPPPCPVVPPPSETTVVDSTCAVRLDVPVLPASLPPPQEAALVPDEPVQTPDVPSSSVCEPDPPPPLRTPSPPPCPVSDTRPSSPSPARRKRAALAVRRLAIDGTVRLPYAFAGKRLRSGRNFQTPAKNGVVASADAELELIRDTIRRGSKIPPKFEDQLCKKHQLRNGDHDEDEEITEIILSRSLACAQFPTPVKFVVENVNGCLRLRAQDVDLPADDDDGAVVRSSSSSSPSPTSPGGGGGVPEGPVCADPGVLRNNLKKLLRRILPADLLRKIGFTRNGVGVDTAVIKALDAAGFDSCKSGVGSAECLTKNVQLLLKWTLPPEVWRQFKQEFKSIESIIAELIS